MGEDMHHADFSNYSEDMSKEEALQSIIESYRSLSEDIDNWVANLSNCSSLIWHAYHSLKIPVNWSGFYVSNSADTLILGPFQGKVACQLIKVGRGVCGTAARDRKTQVVQDVTKFPGHIACDGDTNSEIVVPLISGDKVIGVLDIDCLEKAAFNEIDQRYLEKLAELIISTIKYP